MDPVRISFLLAAVVLLVAAEDLKTWRHNTNYDNPRNWQAERVPCASDGVVFPSDVQLTVLLPSGDAAVRDLVLPLAGGLILPSNGRLSITGESSPSTDCPNPQDVVFARRRPEEWLLPANWISQDDDNPATPHEYRVPCKHDAAIFPPDCSFGVQLPRQTVSLSRLSLHGQDMSWEDWSDFLLSEAGERQFVGPDDDSRLGAVSLSSGLSCRDPAGCSCLSREAALEVCRLQGPLCGPPPHCVSPVRPLGHCCDVCGAYVVMEYDHRFRMDKLKASVERLLKSGGYSGLAWHAGVFKEDKPRVQVVLVDRGDYSTTPAKAARSLATMLEEGAETAGVSRVLVYAAGPYSYPYGAGRIVADVFGPLFGVLAVLGLFYLVYVVYGDKTLVSMLPGGYGSFVFARFDNTADDTTLPETATEAAEAARVEVEVRRPKPTNAFDNPMFGKTASSKAQEATTQKRGAVPDKHVFLELQGRQSPASEDTTEEELLSSEQEDEIEDNVPLAQ